MPAYILGKDAGMYYTSTALTGTNGATLLNAGTSLNEATNVMDVSMDVATDFVDITTRADGAAGFRAQAATFKNASVTFDMKWLPGDAFFTLLKNAWLNNTTVAMYVLDQKKGVSGAQGLCGNFSVSFTAEQPLSDIQKASVTLTLSDNGEWVSKT